MTTTTTTTDIQCLHCNSVITAQDIASGWCESCGKRLPNSVRYQAQHSSPEYVTSQEKATAPVELGTEMRQTRRGIVLLAVLFILFSMVAVFVMTKVSGLHPKQVQTTPQKIESKLSSESTADAR